jgi:aspartate oxidase
MWRFAGVERDADGLTEALGHLDRLQRGTSGDAGRADRASSAIAELEERNLLTIGRLVVLSALARGESRGAHFRRDFPETDATGEHSIMVNRAGEAAIGSSHRLSAREGFIGEVVAAC